jgi:hypothetical protein
VRRTAGTDAARTDAVKETAIDLARQLTPGPARSIRAIVTFFGLTFVWT